MVDLPTVVSFRFGRLLDTFRRFAAVVDDDPDGGFVLYLKFKELAAAVAADAADAAGHRTHFDEEAERVMEWMRSAVGLNEYPGYCGDSDSAKYILEHALSWG